MHSNELKFRYRSLNRKLYLFNTSSASDHKIADKLLDPDLVMESIKGLKSSQRKTPVINRYTEV